MANISQNLLNTTLDQATMDLIRQKSQEILDLLPAKGLTPSERKRMLKMNTKNLIFVRNALEAQEFHGAELLPEALLNDNLKKDHSFYMQLQTLFSLNYHIQDRIQTLMDITAHEAVGSALGIYKVFEMAHKLGIPNATTYYEKLKSRFSRGSYKTKNNPK